MIRLILIVLLFFSFASTVIFAQSNDAKKTESLEESAAEIQKLFKTNPDKAFSETETLIKQAALLKDEVAELKLLEIRCLYYILKIDIKNQILTSGQLLSKSKEFNDKRYQVCAHTYLMDAYIKNALYQKAEAEYKQAVKNIDYQDTSKEAIMANANLHIISSNLYLAQERYQEAIIELHKANKVYEKYPDEEQKNDIFYKTCSNLAGTFLKLNLDSAEYYVRKSIELDPQKENPSLFTYKNYGLLATILQRKKEHSSAIQGFLTADSLGEKLGFSIDRDNVYKGLVDSYEALGDERNAEKYRTKLLNFNYNNEQEKNKSLHEVIENNEKNEKERIMILVGAGLFIIALLVLYFQVSLRRKNKELARQEKISREYLQEQQELQDKEDPQPGEFPKELLDMVKNNDPAFLGAFHVAFPDFQEKLQAINHRIVQTEIEFCALLKLNIPTKEIARYKSIEHRTVQNKKYLIRKKLNIPKDMDIYFWFSQL